MLNNQTKTMQTNTCTTCGQIINQIVLIDGLPYGTTCAENKLGIRQFPSWFKSGDWNEAKLKHQKNDEIRKLEFQKQRKITSDTWAEWVALSRLSHKSYRSNNTFIYDFTTSIIRRLGYFGALGSEISKFNTMEEAEQNYKEYMGSFPYLPCSPRTIDTLSPKQLDVLSKYL